MDAGSHLSNFGNLPKLPLPPTPSTPGLQGIQRTRETTAPGQKELIPSGLAAMAEVMQTPPKIQVTIDDTKQVFQKQLMKPEARTQAKIDTLGTLNSFSNEASALKKRTISSPAVEATAATLHKQKINADILKVQASQLVHDAANGITVKPEVYLKVANSLESVQIPFAAPSFLECAHEFPLSGLPAPTDMRRYTGVLRLPTNARERCRTGSRWFCVAGPRR